MEIASVVTGRLACVPCGTCPYDRLTSVRLYDEWTKLELTFSAVVDYPAGVANNSPELCLHFFDTSLLGEGYTCTLSGAVMKIALGKEAGFMATSKLVTKSGKLKIPPCTCGYDTPIEVTNAEAYTLSAVIQPIVSPHAGCTGLTVSLGSFVGLGNRPSTLHIAYSIVSGSSTASAYPRLSTFARTKASANAFLLTQSGTTVTFPPYSFVDDATYTLQVTLTNFGATGTISASFSTAAYSEPTLSLVGISGSGSIPRKTIYEWDALSLTPLLTKAGCDPANVDLSYSYNWTQGTEVALDRLNETKFQTMYSTDNGVLEFKSYSLLPERTYVLYLSLTHRDYAVVLSTSVIVQVVRSEVISRRLYKSLG